MGKSLAEKVAERKEREAMVDSEMDFSAIEERMARNLERGGYFEDTLQEIEMGEAMRLALDRCRETVNKFGTSVADLGTTAEKCSKIMSSFSLLCLKYTVSQDVSDAIERLEALNEIEREEVERMSTTTLLSTDDAITEVLKKAFHGRGDVHIVGSEDAGDISSVNVIIDSIAPELMPSERKAICISGYAHFMSDRVRTLACTMEDLEEYIDPLPDRQERKQWLLNTRTPKNINTRNTRLNSDLKSRLTHLHIAHQRSFKTKPQK